MNDLTPPPDRPLDDEIRARIRSHLIESTSEPTGPTRRRNAWLVPTVAAAAVVAIVGGGTWMLDRDGNTAAPLDPAGSGASTVGTTPSPTDAQPGIAPIPSSDALCREAVHEHLPGADQHVAQGGPGSGTSIWTKGDRWIVCDLFATLDGGVPTVFAVHAGKPVPTKNDLLISMNFVQSGGGLQSQYVAAGIVAPTVAEITYAFPDGTVSTVVPDSEGFWFMDYQPTSGPLAGGGRLPSEPVTVRVTAGGETTTYTLEWGLDTCAQINHGC